MRLKAQAPRGSRGRTLGKLCSGWCGCVLPLKALKPAAGLAECTLVPPCLELCVLEDGDCEWILNVVMLFTSSSGPNSWIPWNIASGVKASGQGNQVWWTVMSSQVWWKSLLSTVERRPSLSRELVSYCYYNAPKHIFILLSICRRSYS